VELEQRLRMNAYVLVDDELEAREPDALVRQPAELERQLRIADVHHDLGWRRRHAVERDFDDVDLNHPVVDWAGVAFGAGHGDWLRVREHLRRVTAADDRGNAELARDDRGMAGAS